MLRLLLLFLIPSIPVQAVELLRDRHADEEYDEWTLDGELRQTTFLGWRDDKDPSEIVLDS